MIPDNYYDDLLSQSITPAAWCDAIFKEQKNVVYTALTNPKDLNHIVKTNISTILSYLRQRDITSFKEIDEKYEPLKDALNILYKYLQSTPWKPSPLEPLTGKALNDAFEDLCINRVSYATCDRKYNDPEINGQTYALYSFIPSKGVQPDSDGFYGFIKIRGVFGRIQEAEEKAKDLIQYFSANQIFICQVGKPSPVEKELKNKENVLDIDHPKREEKFSELITDQTLKEKREIEEILQKEEDLKADVAKGPGDKSPLQKYIELVQKRATCSYLYTQHKQKLAETKETVLRARAQIADMDSEYPDLKDEYMDHYLQKIKDSGIDKATDDMALMIKNYVGKDDLEF